MNIESHRYHRPVVLFCGSFVSRFAVGLSVVAVLGLAACSSSAPGASPNASTSTSLAGGFQLPAGLAGVVPGQFVAVVDGKPMLVAANGSGGLLLANLRTAAFVDTASGDTVLVSIQPSARILAGPSADHFPGAIPGGVTLLPDALGRWSSDFGPLDIHGQLSRLTFPAATKPVAKLADGYLLVDTAGTSLLRWRNGSAPVPIATGTARVLAIAHDVVAWSDSKGAVVRLTNVETGHTVDIDSGGYAITARFSPDRSRLAILVLGAQQEMVLADTTTGHVVTRIPTAPPDGGLHQFRTLPSGFQPAPFSWNPNTGDLVIVATISSPPTVSTVAPADGAVKHTVNGPPGLTQLVIL